MLLAPRLQGEVWKTLRQVYLSEFCRSAVAPRERALDGRHAGAAQRRWPLQVDCAQKCPTGREERER